MTLERISLETKDESSASYFSMSHLQIGTESTRNAPGVIANITASLSFSPYSTYGLDTLSTSIP